MAKFLDPAEYVKRLAAAQGIDVLNLVKTPETMEAEKQQIMQEQQQAQMEAEQAKQESEAARNVAEAGKANREGQSVG